MSVSCGNVVRDGRSPSFLVIDLLQGGRGSAQEPEFANPLLSDVLTLVTSPAPCAPDTPCPTIFNDLGQATFRLVPKDITAPGGPTSNNQVTISRFRVVYRRTDGRNTQGVDVPYSWEGAVTGTVAEAGSLTLSFELVRHSAKQESPLAQLRSTFRIINTVADVTFWGRDQVGNDISVTGTLQIDFGDFGDF